MAPKIRHDELDHEKNKDAKKDWVPANADPAADYDHEIPREEEREGGATIPLLPPD